MVKYLWQHKIILAVALVLVIIVLLVSACNLINLGGSPAPSGPTTSEIKTPPDRAKVLRLASVQIQSTFTDPNLARVELWVQSPNAAEKLMRSDIPTNGVVLQPWTPEQVGPHVIKIKAYTANNNAVPGFEQSRTIEVIPDTAISLAAVATPPPLGPQPTVIVLTPAPGASGAAAEFGGAESAVAVIQVVATVTPDPTATPIPRYPPPPPIPGVPPGPVQSPELNIHPPVCDSAEYLGSHQAGTERRIFIPSEDDIAAKVTAGTLVHRAWRLRNTGTCTWGPGYELAFYGGRAMGSGGAAFESIFPTDPGRRNSIIDGNRLIVPEGKPNQTAVVEVLLNTPTIPGVHQSYWRMRNPQGVFFGPIVGVTMEVVRDCKPDPTDPKATIIYGAPIINQFRPLSIGNVYLPTPIPVAPLPIPPATPIPPIYQAKVDDPAVVLDWNVIQSQNIDIVKTDPTGNLERISTNDPSDRANFSVTRLGDYLITLYADNGSCSLDQSFIIRTIPPEDQQFVLDLIIFASSAPIAPTAGNATFSANVSEGSLKVSWRHFDPNVDNFVLVGRLWKKVKVPLIDCTGLFGSLCSVLPPSEEWVPVGNEVRSPVGAGSEATVTYNKDTLLCPATFDPNREEYRIVYFMEAQKDGQPASPPTSSNTVEVQCTTGVNPPQGQRPPDEIRAP